MIPTFVSNQNIYIYLQFDFEESMTNSNDLVFNQPVRGLVREILAYLIEDDNLTPLENWFNELVKYTESTTDLE